MSIERGDAFAEALERRAAGSESDVWAGGPDDPGRCGEHGGLGAMLAVAEAVRDLRPVMDAAARARMRANLVAGGARRVRTESDRAGRLLATCAAAAAAVVLLSLAVRPFLDGVSRDGRSRSGPARVASNGDGADAGPVATSVSRLLAPDRRATDSPPPEADRTMPNAGPARTEPPEAIVVVVVPGPTGALPPTIGAPGLPEPAAQRTESADVRRRTLTATPAVTEAATPSPAETTVAATIVACGDAVIAGTVRDPIGRPVIGALVTATRVLDSRQTYEGATAGDGTYRLDFLCPGRYTVSAVLHGPITVTGIYDIDFDGVADIVDLGAGPDAGIGTDINLTEVIPVDR